MKPRRRRIFRRWAVVDSTGYVLLRFRSQGGARAFLRTGLFPHHWQIKQLPKYININNNKEKING